MTTLSEIPLHSPIYHCTTLGVVQCANHILCDLSVAELMDSVRAGDVVFVRAATRDEAAKLHGRVEVYERVR